MPQSFTCLHYHLVFSTKDRHPSIRPDLQPRLHAYIGGILRSEGGTLLAAGGTSDHIHLLCSLNKQAAVSDSLRIIKSNSSKWIHETFPDSARFRWQTGYGAFAVSYSAIEPVRRYIDRQEEHHRERTFKEEFIAMLQRHGMEYDERYLWD